MNARAFAPRPWLAALIVLAAASLLTGCAAQCRQCRQDYSLALRREAHLDKKLASTKPPAQLGLAIRTDLLDDIANTALHTALKAGLAALSNVDVGGGQSIGVQTRGDIVNLNIQASNACNHCFRLGGNLDGTVALNIPYLGHKSTRLGGSVSVVAPLVLQRGQNGTAVLALDLPEAARIGKSSLTAQLTGVRQSWARVLQSKLSDLLLRKLLHGVHPVQLFTIHSPDLGIPGLQIFPVQLVTNARTHTIYVGLATNIDGMQRDPAIRPVTNLAKDQNLALSFNPNLVVHALSLMMQKGVVPRDYDTHGRPVRAGSAHVSISGFRFTRGRAGELPMTLDFRVYNFGRQSPLCFWFTGNAQGSIAIRGQNLDVSLTKVQITQSSVPGLVQASDWANAAFLQGGKRIVRKSLDDQNVNVPGGQLTFHGLAVALDGGAVVLKGASKVAAPRARR